MYRVIRRPSLPRRPSFSRRPSVESRSSHGSRCTDPDAAAGADDSSLIIEEETGPILIHKGKSTSIYRQGGRGFKVIEDPEPTEAQVYSLLREEQLSRFLPRRCAPREVEVKSFQGNPAFHFKWIEGVSLRHWLQSGENCNANMKERLRIAIAITKTLSEFHEGNVRHQYLTADHIIVDTSGERCKASLISLSRAVAVPEVTAEEAAEAQGKDLQDLGHVLNALFSGESKPSRSSPNSMECEKDEEADDLSSSRKRGKQPSPGEGLPLYLTSLISTLILSDKNEGSSETYEDAKSVLSDLRAAERKFHVFFDPNKPDCFPGNNRLNIPQDAFYGRESEVAKLLQSFHSVVKLQGDTAVCVVSGYGGTGKTSLINQIKGPLKDAGGYLIRGKFDPSSRPDSVLFSALDAFVNDVVTNETEVVKEEMKERILQSVGSGCRVLTSSIPSLSKLLGQGDKAENTVGTLQCEFLVCKLIEAVATRSHPVVCFFDDLQWADEFSLDAIQMLTLDPDIKFCHFLLSYRDNEEESKRRVSDIVKYIESQGVAVTTVKLGPIGEDVVNRICSENLYLPPTLCLSLSKVVHSKTSGIVLFVIKFLQGIHDEGILRYNYSLGRFEYNIERIQMKALSGDFAGVSQYLTQQMAGLDHFVLLALKVASCFGFTVDSEILESAVDGLGIQLNALDHLVRSGYLNRQGTDFVFSHDEVKNAAYALVGESKRKSFHLLIGSRLYINTPQEKFDDAVFDIVRHMNIGAELIPTQPQRDEIASLNVEAGQKAIRSSSFRSAATYFLAALSLHGEEDGDYNFLMTVYDLALQPLFAVGDLATLETIVNKSLSLSRSFEEKLNAYHYLVRVYTARGQFAEVLAKVADILQQLEEQIPVQQLSKDLVLQEVSKTQSVLADYSEGRILDLPAMTDKRKLSAMQFMNETIQTAFFARPLLLPMLVCGMIRISLRHGLCELSAFPFAGFGALLANGNDDFDGGARMGHIALEIMKKLGSKKVLARVFNSVYGNIFVYTRPFQSALEKHIEASEEGAVAGDMQISSSSTVIYTSFALWACGVNLLKLEKKTRVFLRRAIEYKHGTQAKCLAVFHSIVLELIGSKEDPFALFFQSTEDEVFRKALSNNETLMCRMIPTRRMFVSLFTGDMEASVKWLEARKKHHIGRECHPRFAGGIVAEFLVGIVALQAARMDAYKGDGKWVNMGIAAIKLVGKWASSSDWNFRNKLNLLEAEHCFCNGEEAAASERYDAAIEAARAHKFVHEEGLANERAARFHAHYGRREEAVRHLARARDCYERWGALALVGVMEREMALLSGEEG